MKQLRYGSLLLIFILVFSSCKIGKNYTQPAMDLPDRFLFAQADTAGKEPLRWWQLFDDPVLDSIIRQALNHNKDLLVTAQHVEASRLQMAIQRAGLGPQLNYAGSASRGNYQGLQQPEVTQVFNALGQVSWEVDFWGKLRGLNEAARASYLASEHGLNSLRLSLISTVATTYFQMLAYRKKTEIAQQTYAVRDSSYKILQERFDAGIIPAIDLHHARIQKAVAAKAIPLYKRYAIQSENFLSLLSGQQPQYTKITGALAHCTAIQQLPAGMPADLLRRRPDIRMAEQELVAQNALVGVAQTARLPAINLTGLLGLASDDLSTLTSGDAAWSISGSLTGPIFNWRKNKNRVKAEQARLQASIHNYERSVLNALREVEDALITIATLKEEALAISQHVEAATAAAALSGERYDKGIASYIEFLESQRQAFDAQMLKTTNQQDLLTAYINLYQALGGGWQ